MEDSQAPSKGTSGIYQIRCLVNSKVYLGSSARLRKRFFKHRRELRNGAHHSSKLQRAWAKYGEEQFVFEVLESCVPSQLLAREQAWLDELRPFEKGYNICREGRNRLGVRHTEETKRKIGNGNRDKRRSPEHLRIMRERCGHPQTESAKRKIRAASSGRTHSEETKKKIGDAQRGKTVSAETRAKISAGNRGNHTWLGRRHTEESKEKMQEAHRGLQHAPETYAKVVETNRRVHGGKTLSPETRAKISAAKKGRKHTEETKRKLREAWKQRKRWQQRD